MKNYGFVNNDYNNSDYNFLLSIRDDSPMYKEKLEMFPSLKTDSLYTFEVDRNFKKEGFLKFFSMLRFKLIDKKSDLEVAKVS